MIFQMVSQLVNENLTDIYYISIIPRILGKGIRLFEWMEKSVALTLSGTRSRNGIAELIYHRK